MPVLVQGEQCDHKWAQNQEKRRSEADTICRLLEEICQIREYKQKNQS
jgi:hypothetical protein